MPSRPDDDRRPRIDWRRIPSRIVLLVSFFVGAAGFGLATYPFDTKGEEGNVLRCGPPIFEVLVPADPAFDVPENTACSAPARARLLVAGLLVVVAVIGAVAVELRSRRSTREKHERWLRGKRLVN